MRGVWLRWLTTTLAILLTPYLVDVIRQGRRGSHIDKRP